MKIALGTAQFGGAYGISNESGKPDLAEVKRLLSFASESGIRILDTAPSYGDAEKVVSELSQPCWQIISKVALPDQFDLTTYDSFLTKQLRNSLYRLGRTSIDCVLLHSQIPVSSESRKLVVDVMCRWKDEGLISSFGFSVYSRQEVDRILDVTVPDVVQLPLSVADQRLLVDGTISKLKDSGVEVHARSIFLQGLLLMPLEKIPNEIKVRDGFFSAWDAWIKNAGLSRLSACLRFVAHLTEVDVVLIGVQTKTELQQCIEALALEEVISVPSDLKLADDKILDPRQWASLGINQG